MSARSRIAMPEACSCPPGPVHDVSLARSARYTKGARTTPAGAAGWPRLGSDLFDLGEHVSHGGLRVAEEQRRVVVVEERVVDAGEAGVHRTLEHDHGA